MPHEHPGPASEGKRVPVSRVVGADLIDGRGGKLGRITDLIVRLGAGGYPPVTGFQTKIGGRLLFVPADRIAALGSDRVGLIGETLNLGQFERRPGEVLLREDVLGRRLIDVTRGKLIHAHDIELARAQGRWELAGVDPTPHGILEHLRGVPTSRHAIVDWSDIEPFVGHVPSARLLLPLRRLRRLHPAQIADLVEHASHDQGDEIITAVGGDPGFEADVFEELDMEHQLEFLQERSNQEAAEILGQMAPDDAVDLITELDQDRRGPILALLPPAHHAKVRSLLAYNSTTAGGMMSPDFVAVGDSSTAGAALDALRHAVDVPIQVACVIAILDAQNLLIGTMSVVELIRADPEAQVGDAGDLVTARVTGDADIQDVALMMADYNLVTLPVVGTDGRMVGMVTVDDLVEALVPATWRRRQTADATN